MEPKLYVLYIQCEEVLEGSKLVLEEENASELKYTIYDAPEVRTFKYKLWCQSTGKELYTRICEYIEQLVDSEELDHETAKDISTKITNIFIDFFEL